MICQIALADNVRNKSVQSDKAIFNKNFYKTETQTKYLLNLLIIKDIIRISF